MLLFIRLLPESTTEHELRQFVHRAVYSPWLRLIGPPSRVSSVQIIRICNPEIDSVEYHGIVGVEPAKTALSVIKKLDERELRGKKVTVRKYFSRSARRDRRLQRPEVRFLAIFNRRKKNRRRLNLAIERVRISGLLQSGDAAGARYSLHP